MGGGGGGGGGGKVLQANGAITMLAFQFDHFHFEISFCNSRQRQIYGNMPARKYVINISNHMKLVMLFFKKDDSMNISESESDTWMGITLMYKMYNEHQ